MLLACILTLSGAGAWFSGHLLKLNDRIWAFTTRTNASLFIRMCKATGMDCDTVLKGAWSQIRIAIPRPHRDFTVSLKIVALPVAFVALAYFVAMGLWFAVIGAPRPFGSGWHDLVLAVALGACAVSLFYLGLMAFRRAPWCLGCIAVHTINFLLLAAIWQLTAATPRLATSNAAVSDGPDERRTRIVSVLS